MEISHLDQFVLTMKDIPTTVDFYCSIMGMQATTFNDNRTAPIFGQQKITLHQIDKECWPLQ